jgi:uncharacterized membrane protein YbhN (UPF0104 family)
MNWKLPVKLGLSAAIVWLVLRSIDKQVLWQALQQANPLWILWAGGWFTLSKIIAAHRYHAFLSAEGILLSNAQNRRLYWTGMYYNLLLPGGISGDAYKIKVLHDRDGVSVKRLTTITLLERASGAAALAQLALVLVPLLPAASPWWTAVSVAMLAGSIPVTYWLFQLTGGPAKALWRSSSVQSVGVQIAQGIAVIGIAMALGAGNDWLPYTALFLVSSVVAMLPLTIGGTGARELTFMWGANILRTDPETAVAVAFLFYLISTLIAFTGIAGSLSNKYLTK